MKCKEYYASTGGKEIQNLSMGFTHNLDISPFQVSESMPGYLIPEQVLFSSMHKLK